MWWLLSLIFERHLSSFEPSHEIMALFVLLKLVLQMRINSHLTALDVWFLVIFERHLSSFEPSHEIMALFVLLKLVLQMRINSHLMALDVWFLVRPFVYFHNLCLQTAKALARLRGCAGSPEPSLVAFVISTIISWAGSFCKSVKRTHTCSHLKKDLFIN